MDYDRGRSRNSENPHPAPMRCTPAIGIVVLKHGMTTFPAERTDHHGAPSTPGRSA